MSISPLDAEGQLVEPLELPAFLEMHSWNRPFCFCIMRGTPRKAQFLVPGRRESPAFGMMCLVCPSSECSYFGEFSSRLYLQIGYSDFKVVNVSELVKWHKNDIAAIKDADIDDSDNSDTLDDGQCEQGCLCL